MDAIVSGDVEQHRVPIPSAEEVLGDTVMYTGKRQHVSVVTSFNVIHHIIIRHTLD